ncbi:MAG TPA: hypothetical protein K8V14_08935 [Staphylococcus ureilyticus]|uniref:hypothetical protein n=1 Tax=Staphylococcus ureilyticus TaxID=94138 RepID=UPI001DB2C9B7|nr:hypothetical protein [Staphylococcus ureilyticus]HJG67426.1 hypothetical protein [Staphylococcus ureilyticus]
MKSYKIIYQKDMDNDSSRQFLNWLRINSFSYILGKYQGSIAIDYNPEKFKNFINQQENFIKWLDYKVEQTIITDQKFAFLLLNLAQINLKFINCKLANGDEKDAIYDEDGKISVEILKDIIADSHNSIYQVTLSTKKNFNRIILTKNGILHFEQEEKSINQIIDIMNVGKEALNEKNS